MNEIHGFSKQYNVCIYQVISLHLGVMFVYVTWLFCELFLKAKSLIKSLKVSGQKPEV